MHTVGSFFALIVYTVIFLKLISYTQVNWWCRNSPEQTKTGEEVIESIHALYV